MVEVVKVRTPPVIRTIDGEMYIEVIQNNTCILAPLGDGSYFVSQVFEKVVKPKLTHLSQRQG